MLGKWVEPQEFLRGEDLDCYGMSLISWSLWEDRLLAEFYGSIVEIMIENVRSKLW